MANAGIRTNYLQDPDSGNTVTVDELSSLFDSGLNSIGSTSLVQIDKTGATDVTAQMQNLVDSYDVVFVEPGTYQVLNLQLTNCRLIGSEGVKFLGKLREKDNCVVIGSNGFVDSIDVDIDHLLPPYLASGDYGNAFRVGAYVQNQGASVRNFGVSRSTITNTTAAAISNAFSIFGDASSGLLKDILFRGRFGTGILTHWSGDVDPDDPHSSTITYSLHPHGIHFENIHGEPLNGTGGDSLITTSASYDVIYKNITLEGWSRILYLLPGDVYDLVASVEQKSKIMTGISYENMEHRNPVPRSTSSTNYPVTVQGLSATPRTAEGVAFATEHEPSIRMDDIRVVWDDAGNTYTGAALIRLYYSKGVSISNFVIEGFQDALCYGYEMRMSNNCSLAGSTDTRYGNRLQASIDCEVDVKTFGSVAARDSGVGQGLLTEAITVGGTLSSAATAGATSISVNPSTSGTVNQGAFVEIGGLFATLKETVQFTSGQVVSVPIDGLPQTASGGDSVTFRAYVRNTSVKGSISQFYEGMVITGAYHLYIEARFNGNGRKDIRSGDTRSQFVEISESDFESVGSTESGSGTKANISLGSVHGWNVHNNRFELSGVRKAERNILQTGDTSGFVNRDNVYGYSSSTSVGWVPQNTTAAKKARNQIYGNQSLFSNAEIASTVTFGYLVGGNYTGYSPSAPTSGYWVKGDILRNPTASAGQPRGWQCVTTSETGGTWVSLGNL